MDLHVLSEETVEETPDKSPSTRPLFFSTYLQLPYLVFFAPPSAGGSGGGQVSRIIDFARDRGPRGRRK